MFRFVIQRHTKRKSRHYDLMLEHGRPSGEPPRTGAGRLRAKLKTWQINTPFSYQDRTLLATTLPDHRKIYLTYEGKISRGRGTVRIMDHGQYHPEIWARHYIIVKFMGGKLKGRYLFLKTSPAKPAKWLISRLRG